MTRKKRRRKEAVNSVSANIIRCGGVSTITYAVAKWPVGMALSEKRRAENDTSENDGQQFGETAE
jgi:hypothetical protein